MVGSWQSVLYHNFNKTLHYLQMVYHFVHILASFKLANSEIFFGIIQFGNQMLLFHKFFEKAGL